MDKQVKKIILAPMEGVLDGFMRELLTSINDYDLCITEFVRVVDKLVPAHMLKRICPELLQGGKTANNTPVRVQLLGQDPICLADNAAQAIELGSHGVDINFGCPAKAVNKSKGGAVLLQDPELIYRIMLAVRQSVAAEEVVSAKIRLGFEDSHNFHDIVEAVNSAGSNMLTIHARTKTDGYRPPAYWHFIGELEKKYPLDIIANGEIWSKEQAINCMVISKTNHLMLGRGALALPNLANVIRNKEQPYPYERLLGLLLQYCQTQQNEDDSYYFSSRLKQWLRYLRIQYPAVLPLFDLIKTLKHKDEIEAVIKNSQSITNP